MTIPRPVFEKSAFFHTKYRDGRSETSVVTKADIGERQLYLVGSMHPSTEEQAASGLLAIQATDEQIELSEVRLLTHEPERMKRTLAILAQAALRPWALSEGGRIMVTAETDSKEEQAQLREVLGMGKHVPEGKRLRGKRVRAFAKEALAYSAKTMRDVSTYTTPNPANDDSLEQRAV
ncbi:MAG TPA: hypothetical protein VFT59_00210 [Candidatus Saccharimonadales bacterium]|nr:hypothetical protein [Candidatus Saccharimonadales bacterium]